MRLSKICRALACSPAAALCLTVSRAAELVSLDATSLSVGALPAWSNSGSLGGNFTAEFDVPVVTTISGVKGVTFDGSNDWYVGPTAPAQVTGNGSRSAIAWIYNPSIGTEETIVAWGRRGGGNGTDAGFIHGTHATWGALGQWGDLADVGWNGAQETGVWTCVAYSYNSSTGTSSVYTNGQLSNSEVNGPLSTFAVSNTGAALPIVVGCQNSAAGARNNSQIPASLTIAKLKVYDTVLSPAEIAAACNADAATFGRVIISQFTASSPTIYRGDSTTLSWSVGGATGVSISPSVTIPPGNTTVSVNPLVTTTYTLTATGPGGSAAKTATIIVDPGAPTANAQSVAANMNTPKPVTLTATDPNTPAGSLTWSVVAAPAHGTLDGTAAALTYTPATGYSGLDSFTFKVNDGFTDSNTATVSITVNPPNTAPTAVTTSASTIPSTAVAGSFIANLASTDPNFGETHSYQLVAGTGSTHNGYFSISGNQLISQHNFSADVGVPISIRVRSTDSNALSFDQILTFTVVAAPGGVVINEIYYDPDNNERTDFIELHNNTTSAIALGGWQFTNGITYTFPGGATIAAGGYVVVAMDAAAFQIQFGFAPLGQFSGKLSGDGELVELRNAANAIIDQVDYKAEFPWPISAASGASMELIHPSLDNNLAGSWRGSVSNLNYPALTYVTTASTGWHWRTGSSEASNPNNGWRANGFVEDGTWSGNVQAPIGFGTISSPEAGALTLNTTITGMQNSYRSFFARKTFTVAVGEVPSALHLRFTLDDGILIWINGRLAAQRNVSTISPTISTQASTSQSPEALWYDVDITNAGTYLEEGTNTIAVQVFNSTIGSNDACFDLELKRPAGADSQQPTPNAQNSVFSATAPPQIRQVDHSPKQPAAGQPTTITAKITDPQGVGQVRVLYQIVAPGSFIPARFPRTVAQVMAAPEGERPINADFENAANWTTAAMFDDGTHGDAVAADSVFTAVIPAQSHRTLVRYRITAADLPGLQIRVPYADDPSLNFAYFVYNGVPDYVAATASVDPGGAGKVWPKSMLTSLPVYHWIIRHQDMMTLQAYNASEQFTNNGTETELLARRAEEWEGAFVYDGVVYDHVCTRLRGGNSRYGDFDGRFPNGKRHYKFQFNTGKSFQARDQNGKNYPTKWSALALNRMFGTKGGNGWGMPEEIGATLWKTFGVPAQNTHWLHFRVIDDAAEAPDQYNGDFWGITQAVEEYDGNYLDARGMTKGNLYKMSDWIWDAERQRRYQSPDMVRDGSEFNNIRDNLHGGQSAAWLNQYVNYEKWYRYSAVAEGIRHYDIFPYTDDIRNSLKNLAWYFEPVGTDPARGVCNFLPYDWDASFGPSFNNGWEHANNALYGWDSSTTNGLPYIDKPEMKLAHRNILREFRDLIWQPDQVNGLLDDRAAVIAEFSKADQDRWKNAPAGSGTANDDALATKVQDMKNFCFTGWSGASGPTVGAGGRGTHLDNLADAADAGLLPAKPTITYTGAPNHPLNGLSFQTTAFSDPQGAGTFAAMAWRIGEIENPAAPAYDPADDFKLEYNAVWETGTLATFQNSVSIPAGALKPGCTYRARVRMQDNTGRWSHWSAPYQFTAVAPAGLVDLQTNLMVTEIMYNPAGPALPGGSAQDFEYIELQNLSNTLTLDLTNVGFTNGVHFSFAGSAVTSLTPGARAVVVSNLAAFQSRYGTSLPVAGAWLLGDNLSNGGERLELSYGSDVEIRWFSYDDEGTWPTTPDGGGPSLQLIDPFAVPPDLGNGLKWQASATLAGSPGNPDSRFAVWMSQRNATDPNAEPIPGMNNILIYALGADLAANPAGCMPVASFTAGTGDAKHLTLSFRTRITGTDVTYLPETSTDTGTWQSGPSIIEQVGSPVVNGDGTETVTVRVIENVADHPVRLIRLRVALAE